MFDSGVRHLQIASAKVNSNSIGKALLLFVDRKYTGVRVGAVYSERTLRDLYGMELLPEGSGLTVESQTGGTLYQSGGRGRATRPLRASVRQGANTTILRPRPRKTAMSR